MKSEKNGSLTAQAGQDTKRIQNDIADELKEALDNVEP